jgi:MOSC domain-containing protein YiiM
LNPIVSVEPFLFGRVLEVYITPGAGAVPISVPRIEALPDLGLRDDRYALGTGSFSRWPGSGRAVTLIESEVLAAIAREHGLDLSKGQHRRNIVTVGIRLHELNGRRFSIGNARMRGARLCEPCRYLERLAGAGALAALRGRGGLRADVLKAGSLVVGDQIRPEGEVSFLP